MLFNFELMPVDDIAPWGREGDKCLHWFGLTDSWYWIDVGGQELFRHSDAALAYWRDVDPEYVPLRPYVDYPVVRLWEDVMSKLPSPISPIPSDVASMLANRQAWDTWLTRVDLWVDEDEAKCDLWMKGMSWWGGCSLDSPFLLRPHIYIYTVDNTTHIRWDNRDCLLDNGIPKWQAMLGELTMPAAQFVDELTSFDARLLAAMADRIESIKQGWSRPEIAIDVAQLDREQRERSTWLPAALARPEDVDWDDVRRAMDRIRVEVPYGDN